MMAQRIEEPLTDAERREVIDRIHALDATSAWLHEHYAELVRQFPDRWVAVAATGVADSDTDYERLASRVDRAAVQSGQIFIEFIPSKPLNLIL